MKKILIITSLLVWSCGQLLAQPLSPYFKVAEMETSLQEAAEQVENTVTNAGYEVIGSYHPAQNENFYVVCFTNKELKDLSLEFPDRGALAATMKAGFVSENGKVTLTLLNPEYMFLAYWGEQLNGQEKKLKEASEKVKNVFKQFGTLQNYGGEEDADDLPHYHYMMMMPYFDEPEELATFDSFEEGLKIIRDNLNSGKGKTQKVYELVFPEKEIAVFGVGLWDEETGEAHFLPIVGEGHIANLPYEIILQGKDATMLAGKYRIALFWPELSMGTFMKIKSTPGDIEDIMEGLTEK
jgi:hypothetical protein